MIAHRARRAIALAAALALVVLPAIGWATPPPALAADPGLTIVGDATYTVVPEEGKVSVAVVLTATNHLKDTKTKRYFFRVGYVTVLPNTANFRLTAAAGKPKVTVSSKTDTYTNLKLDFGANLAAGKSTTLTLTFDVVDPGGAPDRAVRIARSLVSFAAWAVAAPQSVGGSVVVRFPEGYDVAVRRGPMSGPTKDATGHDVWSSGQLAAPLDFVADFSADRPTEYSETTRTIKVQAGEASVVLQAWPDDSAWEQRVGRLIEQAIPLLEEDIGLPSPSGQPLEVREALVRATGGFAGIYDPAEHRIDIAYAASDAVVIHELAHAWFNGSLVADRWIAEGFASHYAELVAKELGIDPAPLPPSDGAEPLPLNAWGAASADATDAEVWGYAASLELADRIAARAGEDKLREVWSRAARGIGGYQPTSGPDEAAAGPPDWRGLLDVLEDTTGKDFSDLWRTSVAREQDLQALEQRAAAKVALSEAMAAAGDWQLPASTRAALRAWRFDVATQELGQAMAVLVLRDKLQASAAEAGATLPGTLRATFEGDSGLGAAAAEASAEQAVVDAIAAARAARPTQEGLERLVIDVGLLFQDPDAGIQQAIARLAAGDLQPAFADATAAEDTWRGAAEAGRNRILSVILLVVATVLLVGLVRRGLFPPPPGVRAPARVRAGRTDTLAGHPAGSTETAADEGGTATQA